MGKHHKINYIEFPVTDINKAKLFYTEVFGWQFIDYGSEYCSITGAAIDAGFYLADQNMSTGKGSALIVIYSKHLNQTLAKVKQNGGKIIKPIFSFPGGQRFHFSDTCGNELAVWSDK